MSRDIQKHLRFDPETGRPLPAETDFAALAAELVESAKGQGIELTGPNGLLTGLTRQVLQTALEVEMSDHLGYDKHDFDGRNGQNSRNGSTPKTLRTEIGEVTVQIPRDRQGTFEPAIVPKYQRRIAGFDEAVVSLYAKGLTTGDIQAHLSDVYGQDISRELVSKVTDRVVADMEVWQARPLDPVYPVILIDAIVMKVRDGQVGNRPVYVALGIDLDGHRDVLGMWVGPTGGEGSKQWMNMLTASPMSCSSVVTD
jgi:putative transposase